MGCWIYRFSGKDRRSKFLFPENIDLQMLSVLARGADTKVNFLWTPALLNARPRPSTSRNWKISGCWKIKKLAKKICIWTKNYMICSPSDMSLVSTHRRTHVDKNNFYRHEFEACLYHRHIFWLKKIWSEPYCLHFPGYKRLFTWVYENLKFNLRFS